MLKLVLREPVPDGLQSPKNFMTQEGNETTHSSVPAEYARTMQSFMIKGNLEEIGAKAKANQPLPLDDTWFEFVKANGKKIVVPGSNIAFIEEV